MPASLSGGWAARLRTIFGVALSEIGEKHLQLLVNQEIREDADLDFKETLYGNGDSERREFAADIAAMANDRGGLLVIGVRDEADVAVKLTPVPLGPAEEGRMRAMGAGNLAPFAPFEILPVEAADPPGHRYYLVVVPPSADRPHAVRKDIDLRYPRRHGASKRWLSESEVADAYRDRFTRTGSDVDRVRTVLEQGRQAMKPTEERPLLAIAIAPSQRGSLLIDEDAVKRAEERVRRVDFVRGESPFDAPWAGLIAPLVGVGQRRLRIGTPSQRREIDTHYTYAELHVDGCTFFGEPINSMPPMQIGLMPGQSTEEQCPILVTQLTIFAVSCLLSAAKLSAELTGAFGDCSVVAALIGNNMRLVSYDGDGLPVVASGTPSGPVLSPHTVNPRQPSRGLIGSTCCHSACLFRSGPGVGEPELASISPDGELLIHTFPRTYHPQLQAWAGRHGIGIATKARERA